MFLSELILYCFFRRRYISVKCWNTWLKKNSFSLLQVVPEVVEETTRMSGGTAFLAGVGEIMVAIEIVRGVTVVDPSHKMAVTVVAATTTKVTVVAVTTITQPKALLGIRTFRTSHFREIIPPLRMEWTTLLFHLTPRNSPLNPWCPTRCLLLFLSRVESNWIDNI